MTININRKIVKKFEASIISTLLLLSSISLVMFFTMPVSACYYTIGTYESDYDMPKISFYKGETVYGKGTVEINRDLKLRIRDPDGNIVYYSNASTHVVTGSFELNNAVLTGTWNIQLGVYKCGHWKWSESTGRISYFTVSDANFSLTININGNGSVEKDPDKDSYHYGEVVNLSAFPDTCWSFSHWSNDLSGEENPAEIVMTEDKNVTAHFESEEIYYALTVEIEGNGSVEKNPDQLFYEHGEVVNLSAIADPGWSFLNWTGDLNSNNQNESIIMDSNKFLIAHFEQNNYTLTINIEGSGSIVKNPDQISYIYGTIVELTANPDSGFIFDYWSGNLTGNSNPAKINMTENKNVTAHFKVSSNNGGNGNGGGNNGGGSNNGRYTSTKTKPNIPPKAVAGGPYYGYVDEIITFNGSNSYDIDHYITSYHWNLGDGSIEYGEVVTHNYSEVGEYKVVLTVTDIYTTGSNETVAIIIELNNPPSKPNITGPAEGIIDIVYIFSIVSTDDGNEIKYTIDWGDGKKTESNTTVAGQLFNVPHKWTKPGIYMVNVTADDGEKNATAELTIKIGNSDEPDIHEENNFILIIFAFLALMFLLLFLLLAWGNKKDDKGENLE